MSPPPASWIRKIDITANLEGVVHGFPSGSRVSHISQGYNLIHPPVNEIRRIWPPSRIAVRSLSEAQKQLGMLLRTWGQG